MPKVSVIVPVYNTEQFIKKCADSLLKQTLTDLEIILIDDGSLDNLAYICDDYAKRDVRIHVIHKENGGLADARNVALDMMTGKYVVCVDSDDYISPTHIEGLYNLIEKYGADVSVNTFCSFYEGSSPNPSPKSAKDWVLDGLHATEMMFYQEHFDNTAWGKMYKASLFDGIRYPKGLLFEDLPTTYRLLLKANKVVFNDEQSYFYLLRSNSIEGTAFSPHKLDSGLQLMALMDKDRDKLKPIIKSYNCRIVSFVFHLLLQMPEGYAHRNDFERRIKTIRLSVLMDNRARKKARLACLLSFIGFGVVQKIFNKVKTRK